MPPSPSASCVGQAGRLGDGDAPQALGQFLERRGTRQHRRDEPLPRPGDVTATYPRQQPGPHHAGLARPRTADDQHEPSTQVVAGEPGEDLVDEVGTAEEVGGVGLVEGPQALVRVRQRPSPAGSAPVSAATSSGTNSAIGGRPAVATPRARTSATGPGRGRGSRWTMHGEVVHVVAGRVGSDRPRRGRSRRGRGPRQRRTARSRGHPAVHDPGVGGRHQRPADATDQRRQRCGRQRTAAQPVGQRPTVHPAHHEVSGARLPPVVMDRDDCRVAQRRHPMGAGLERPHELGAVGDLLPDDANREVALDPGQAGGEHGAVATRAEPLTEAIPAQRQPSGLGEHQRRVVGEHPLLELGQRRRRLEAELLDEHAAVVAVHAERVGLTTGAVQGDHQLRSERLAQRVLARPATRSPGSSPPPGRRPARPRRDARARPAAAPPDAAPQDGPSPRRRTRRRRRRATATALRAAPTTPQPRRRAPTANRRRRPSARSKRHRTPRPAAAARTPAPASPPIGADPSPSTTLRIRAT